ncbi:MAG: phosphotransferase [Syntrophothermus sp.]
MPDRFENQQEVRSYLQKHLSAHDWHFSIPPGSGMETYFVRGNGHEYFVKVGAPVERYQVMAEIGLSPPVITSGRLENGLTIFVQPRIRGRVPSRRDFQCRLDEVAAMIHKMHFDPQLHEVLPQPSSKLHKDAGRQALDQLLRRWKRYRVLVPHLAPLIDNKLEDMALQLSQFSSGGLVASHNDICNGNWLFTRDGKIYILDLYSMAMDDPALDMGALLWWYYPPALRGKFLAIAGYPYDEEFKFRMQIRMALHCLSITLPRDHGFEEFQADRYHEALTDFIAVVDGKENPQGYA